MTSISEILEAEFCGRIVPSDDSSRHRLCLFNTEIQPTKKQTNRKKQPPWRPRQVLHTRRKTWVHRLANLSIKICFYVCNNCKRSEFQLSVNKTKTKFITLANHNCLLVFQIFFPFELSLSFLKLHINSGRPCLHCLFRVVGLRTSIFPSKWLMDL